MNQVWRRCCLATIFAVRWFGFWNNKKNNNKTTKLHKKKFSSRKQQKCQKKEKTFRSAFNSKKSREPLSQNTKRINAVKNFLFQSSIIYGLWFALLSGCFAGSKVVLQDIPYTFDLWMEKLESCEWDTDNYYYHIHF